MHIYIHKQMLNKWHQESWAWKPKCCISSPNHRASFLITYLALSLMTQKATERKKRRKTAVLRVCVCIRQLEAGSLDITVPTISL